jgi:hypothetical protein
MKTIPLFTIVDVDDWSALYENDKSVHQGHSTRSQDLIDAARGRPFMLRRVCGGEHLTHQAELEGELPASLSKTMESIIGWTRVG